LKRSQIADVGLLGAVFLYDAAVREKGYGDMTKIGIYASAERIGGDRRRAITNRETAVGHKYDYDRVFIPFLSAHNALTKYMQWTVSQGRTPIVSYYPKRDGGSVIKYSEISRGEHDRALFDIRDSLVALGHPVMAVFNHEPENEITDIRTGMKQAHLGNAEEWCQAYRYFVNIVRTNSNIQTMPIFMGGGTFNSPEKINKLYPGDEYCNAVGGDGYNWAFQRPKARWRSCIEANVAGIRFAQSCGKPFIICETGCADDPKQPNRKGDWFRQAAVDAPEHPNLEAVCYFDNKALHPWWVDSTPKAFQGYKEMVNRLKA
jgi:hypothetical protein